MHLRDPLVPRKLLGLIAFPWSMSWVDAAPAALVALAWLLLPGLPVGYALGLRGVAAWGAGALTGVALVPLTATVGAKAGVGWSVWPPIAVGVAVAVIVGAG